MFTKDTLCGKNILITGGGTGLGLAMARKFLEHGAQVAICGRRSDVLEAAIDELQSIGPKVIHCAVDVRDYQSVSEMFDQISRELGAINGLINNAAGNFYSLSEDLSADGFQSVIEIVLIGSFNCSSNFGKRLIEQKLSGNILNILTTYTQTGAAFILPSACAKAGVYAMTTSLAYEWAVHNIRVNAIAPGLFPTKGAWEKLMPDAQFEETYRESLPLQRFGELDEFTNLATFLMSDLSPYLTGDCVTIDGAEHLKAGQFNFLANLVPRDTLGEWFKSLR